MTSQSRSNSKLFLVIALLIACLIAGFALKMMDKPLKERVSADLLPTPVALSSFHLTDTNQQAFTQNNLLGKWSILFFGFTNCASICPVTMDELKQTYANLQSASVPLPNVYFISIDPNRDSMNKVKTYVDAFNPNFIGVVGKTQSLDALTKQLSVLYVKVKSPEDGQNPNNYQIDHTGSLFLFNPEGKLAAIFTYPHDAKNITHDYETIVKANGQG